MTEVARCRHEAGVTRYFVPNLAAGGRGWSSVLLGCWGLSCGGLAVDGPRGGSAAFDPDLNGVQAAEQLARRSAEPRSEPEEPPQPEPRREPPPGGASAGQACSALPGEGAGIVVGTVELRSAEACSASSWCLLRAPPAEEYCGGNVYAAPCTTEPAIPVPPPRSVAGEWQEDTCTCRCDGEATDVDYCACPQGMRCAPLIPSAGVNAAARSFIGSYCVY